jgi:transposase
MTDRSSVPPRWADGGIFPTCAQARRSVLAEAGLPVICVETRHMRTMLKAQINKTDRNDARGLAQMMRVGLYRPVHVKTLRSQKLRVLLTHRKLLQWKAIAIENEFRATLRNFGLKVAMIGTVKFETRIRELVEGLPDLAVLVERCSSSGGSFASSSASCIAA